MGSLRGECLDHILIHDVKHLQRVVQKYTNYYNQERPHQGIGQRIPNHYAIPESKPTRGRITSQLCARDVSELTHTAAVKLDTLGEIVYIDPQNMKSSGICLLVNGGFPPNRNFQRRPSGSNKFIA